MLASALLIHTDVSFDALITQYQAWENYDLAKRVTFLTATFVLGAVAGLLFLGTATASRDDKKDLESRVAELEKKLAKIEAAPAQVSPEKIKLASLHVLLRGPGYQGIGDGIHGQNPFAIQSGVRSDVFDGSTVNAGRIIGAWITVGTQPNRYRALGNYNTPEITGLKVSFHTSLSAPQNDFIWLEVCVLYIEK
jgi:hypothetical protein